MTTFNCTMCERGFNTNYLLKKHMQKAHDVELVSKMPQSDQVIIAQQQMDEVSWAVNSLTCIALYLVSFRAIGPYSPEFGH